MAIIYMNIKGSNGGGGPSVFAYKMSSALIKEGHNVIYNNPDRSDVALCIIESGKVLGRVDRSKTRVAVRLDGAYFKEYWHGGPGREWRSDMTALHKAIVRDVACVDVMIYQSNFSKKLIDDEIARRDDNFAIIHNGVDTSLFKPYPTKSTKTRLIHVGLMRNGYIMESLMGVYNELKKRGHDVSITLVGSMDGECKKVFSQYRQDPDIRHIPSVPNSKLPALYGTGDIYLGPRQGSSSDNVIAEAQSCGLPVIIPSWGGNKDMVKDGVSGIVVPSVHWDYTEQYWCGMADGVEKVMEDLDGFKTQARNHAVANLDIRTMVDKYLKAAGV